MNTEEKFILGALVGTALGAAAALIFTPMTGKNLRAKLLNGFSQSPASLRRKPTNRTAAHRDQGHDSNHESTHGTQLSKSKTTKSHDLVKKVRAKKKVPD